VGEPARRLTAIPGVDVLKAEFPGDSGDAPRRGYERMEAVPDESAWLEACRELTAVSQVPWVLLSAGAEFETFLHQAAVAARAGASGVAVGRAVWQEAAELEPEARAEFLSTTARERMARVTALCQALARGIGIRD